MISLSKYRRRGTLIWISTENWTDFVCVRDGKVVDAGAMMGWSIGGRWAAAVERIHRYKRRDFRIVGRMNYQ